MAVALRRERAVAAAPRQQQARRALSGRRRQLHVLAGEVALEVARVGVRGDERSKGRLELARHQRRPVDVREERVSVDVANVARRRAQTLRRLPLQQLGKHEPSAATQLARQPQLLLHYAIE